MHVDPAVTGFFLCAMGARVGARTFWNHPQMRAGVEHITTGRTLHAGMQQFWSTQSISVDGVAFKPIVLGNMCTVGQRSVVMPGVTFGDHVTVGSEGLAFTDMEVGEGSTVFGCPPTIFASNATDATQVAQLQRAINQGDDSTISMASDAAAAESTTEGSATFFSTFAVLLNLLKIPLLTGSCTGLYIAFGSRLYVATGGGLGGVVATVVALYLAFALAFALFIVLATRSGLASFQKGSTSYYTCRFTIWWLFVWLNRLTSGLVLYPFHGTAPFSWWLRAMGARVGSRCFIDPGGVGLLEVDNLFIGSDSIVLTPNVHGHFVDHQQLQFAPVVIGKRARLNDGSTVMPFVTLADDVSLRAHCTTIKGQRLDPGVYQGSPATRTFGTVPAANYEHVISSTSCT